MYGALVFKKRDEQAITNLFSAEYTLVLSEWTNEDPDQVQRRLRSGTDWYAIKKGSVKLRRGYKSRRIWDQNRK